VSARAEEAEILLPSLLDWQERVASTARRYNTIVAGRRIGKSVFLADRLVHPALAGYPVAAFSPTYKMLTEFWREAVAVFRPVIERQNTQERRLELVTGGVVDMWSLTDPNTARGRKYKRVVVDEAAMAPSLPEAWEHIIRPTLTDYRGDAWFGSTPKGLNYFHTLYEWGQDPSREEWASWQMPTSENPLISRDEIEAARQELPEDTFEQEYLAEFVQNAGAVFRNVAACLTAPGSAPFAHYGHQTVAGADFAQKQDFTAVSVGCADCREELELVRFNQLDWATQRARVKETLERWRVRDALLEANSIGQPNLEALAEEGLPVRGFDTTPSSKGPLIRSLALCFEREEFRFLADPVGKNELLAYEVTLSPETHRPRYSAVAGKHDDTVIARALMFRAADSGGPALDREAASLLAGAGL
jgi:hypothetical protein